jgi:hypothetical protein
MSQKREKKTRRCHKGEERETDGPTDDGIRFSIFPPIDDFARELRLDILSKLGVKLREMTMVAIGASDEGVSVVDILGISDGDLGDEDPFVEAEGPEVLSE